MALETAYKQFLAAPNSSFLSADASLHYITTLTSVNGSSAIIKYLKGQNHELKKKEEKVLDVVEGPNNLAVEVSTTLEFLTGGGAYLPSLDDNFLADRIVTLPIIHIVSFDADGKITQIRQSWDQGSLLKLIDVIGKTGRNWPIRDGKDQIKLIANSVKSTGKPSGESSKPDEYARSRTNSTNPTRDPHATLSLFAPREKNIQEALPSVVAPRASSKPAARDYGDLFVGNESDQSTPSRGRNDSPSKYSNVMAKGGATASKNYAPSRLFDNEENSPARPSPMKETNPKKYQHFDFGDGSDPTDAPAPRKEVKASRHGSQWGFNDFNTPAKVVPTKGLRTNEVRHWGNSDDEVMDSPIKNKKVDKPRKDAETHFEFQDDGTPEGGERRIIGRPRGQGQNNGLGLYKNNLYDDETGGEAGGDEPKKFRPIANTQDRRKDFDPHFAMTDDSPASKQEPKHISDDRAKAVKMMDANWSAYDQSPSQKENIPASPSTSRPSTRDPLSEATNRGIKTDGDGMGGKKNSSFA
ncbi:hypothetical protein LSUE1_G010169, partial [Lachnellula suecica]